jgi:hypothetical protein
MKSIGFTGTQSGMNAYQKERLEKILKVLQKRGCTEFHHGDCIGADEQAHDIALKLGYGIIIHPPIDEKKRAFCEDAKEIRKPKKYIARNHDIVDESDGLLATPYGETEIQRGSGTWATIRYARDKTEKHSVLIHRTKIIIKI